MERGLSEWNEDSEQEMNKGYKRRDTELATMPELVNFIFIWVSDNVLLYQRRKKANLFCTGRISSADITEKIIPVHEPLVKEILMEVMLLGEQNSRLL